MVEPVSILIGIGVGVLLNKIDFFSKQKNHKIYGNKKINLWGMELGFNWQLPVHFKGESDQEVMRRCIEECLPNSTKNLFLNYKILPNYLNKYIKSNNEVLIRQTQQQQFIACVARKAGVKKDCFNFTVIDDSLSNPNKKKDETPPLTPSSSQILNSTTDSPPTQNKS